MTAELEQGFGTGLRMHLQRRSGEPELEAPVEESIESNEPERLPEPEAQVVQLLPDPGVEAAAELAAVRTELESSLTRERQLRDALEHQVEAHERELAERSQLALKEAEAEQLTARLAVREAELADREAAMVDREDVVANERRDLNLRRTELLAEEARLTELGTRVDGWATSLESADREQADASAELAKQLATIAEREREVRRTAAALDERRAETEARLAARERAARELEVATRQREQGLVAREDELDRQLARLQQRVDAIARREADVQSRLDGRDAELASREATTAERLDAREFELAAREADLSAEHDRVRSMSDRIDRERMSHGRATQDAFELLAELERREEAANQREQALTAREQGLTARETEVAKASARHLVEAPRPDPQIEAREALIARGETHLSNMRRDLDELRERAARTEQDLAARATELEQREHALRLDEARLTADHELRGDALELMAAELSERERQLTERERDLAGYVGELQEALAGQDRTAA